MKKPRVAWNWTTLRPFSQRGLISRFGRNRSRATVEPLESRRVLSAVISGYKFLDQNCDGIRNTDLIQGSSPDIIFVVDVSSSTAVGPGAVFVGQPVGDVNGDGASNTILDAELAGFKALNQQLIAQGLGDTADVGVILFGGNAVQLDVDSVTAGTQITIKPNRDLNSNGIKDIEELLSLIRHGGQGISSGVNGSLTNYESALQATIAFFNSLGTATGNGNMVFLTDGQPNSPSTSTAVYADEVATLNSMNINLNAFGAGGSSSVPPLQVIDPGAVRFDSTDELLAAFSGLQGSKTVFREPGLAGVRIWLDINQDGVRDADEPFTFSQTDDPLTAIDETGNYRFEGLPAGTYDVREDIPAGMIQTAPAGGFTTITTTVSSVDNVFFGNRPGEISGMKWSDLNGNGIRDRLLVGDQPDVVFVIDISGSTTSPFIGTQAVGDLNGDGLSNTVLDAEIAGFIALNQSMITAGFGVVGTVSIIAFETSALSLDLDPVTAGIQIATNPLADRDGNGVRDVDQALRQLTALGTTSYEAALAQALSVFTTLGTPAAQSNLIFLSDGAPNISGAHADEVAALRAAGHQNLRAFGAGTGASLTELQIIDTGAQIFNSPDELVSLFGGVQGGGGASGGFTEPGLPGVTIFIDTDNDGIFDPGEPSTVTASDNPLTPENEAGTYTFSSLSYGTYVVREVPPIGQFPTYPTLGYHEVIIGFGSLGCVLDADFGNALPGSIEGTKWYDADQDGFFDFDESTLSDVLIYIDGNNNGILDTGERWTTTDREGYYRFDNLAPGYHVVREELNANCPWVQTAPIDGYYTAFVSSSQTVSGLNFGNYLTDFAWIDNGFLQICGIDTDDLIGIYFDPTNISVQVNNHGYQFPVASVSSVIADAAGGNDKLTVQGFFSGFIWIRGGWGNDNLTGGPGDETMTGGDGDDVLAGGGGDDYYIFDTAGDPGELDVLIELPQLALPAIATVDNDTISFLGSPVGVIVDLKNPAAVVLQGNRRVVGAGGIAPEIETVYGSYYDDTIKGNDGDNQIEGRDGADRITGRGGNDTLLGEVGDDIYYFDADLALGIDTIVEADGEGRDQLNFADTSTAVSVNLPQTALQTVNANLQLILGIGAYVEDITGGTSGDILKGSGRVNRVSGGGGNDLIEGRGANDVLTGGPGDDTYLFDSDTALGTDTLDESGGGNDTLDFSATATLAVAVSLKQPALQTVNGNLKLILSSDKTVENLIGGSLGDTLIGNTLANRLRGNGGSDLLTGDAGNDTYLFDTDLAGGTDTINESGGGNDTLDFSETTTRSVTVNLSTAVSQTVNSGLQLILGSGAAIENVIGGGLGDTLTGNALANRLAGNGGSDLLTGAAGNDIYLFDADAASGTDTISDVSGVDLLDFSQTTTQAVEVDLSLTAAQVVTPGLLSLVLSAANSIENVTGGSLNDTLTGNSLANVIRGGDGNDILTGAGGNDYFVGGLGNDQYRFDTDLALGTDTIDESGGGEDVLNFSQSTTRAIALNLAVASAQVVNAGLTLNLLAGDTIENVIGGSLNDSLTGNSLGNRLNGNSGNDTLNGGVGDDVYVFDTDLALGSDTIIDNGGGRDTLDFSATTTRQVSVSLGIAAAQVVNAGLTLTLSAGNTIENVLGGGLGDTITGNALDNILAGGGGNDTLTGLAGRDLLIGGLGVDSVFGGDGEDILIGGTTSFDTSLQKLMLLMSEWSRTDLSYAQRINHLRTDSGGKNGNVLLKVGTVQNDAGAADQLTGGNDLDWFFSSISDNLLDILGTETKTTI